MIDATLGDDGQHLSGLRLVSEGFPPSAALKSAAERRIAKADSTLGRCKLGSTDRSDGQERAVFPLTCERGEADLDVSIPAGSRAQTPNSQAVIREHQSAARCH